METVTLQNLLKAPGKVRKMTQLGKSVKVTEKGAALWVIVPAPPASGASASGKRKLERTMPKENGATNLVTEEAEAERIKAIDAILDEVLREVPSKISASKLLLDSRR